MDPKDINFAAMPQTAIKVVTKPAEFFRGMPKTGGFLEPLIFAVIMGVVAGVIQVVWGYVAGGYGHPMTGGLRAIIAVPIAVAIFSFLVAAILYVIWKMMGSQENYETAFRCCAYLAALMPVTSILGFIPYVGVILNMGIFAFYLVTVSIHVHHLPSQKAWLVFGIIALILALLLVSAERQGRRMMSKGQPWQTMGEDMDELRRSTRGAEKSADDARRQAEKMAREYDQQRRLQEQDRD
ncbi:MAG: YIP1 family protein [Smithellaceae bacterium]